MIYTGPSRIYPLFSTNCQIRCLTISVLVTSNYIMAIFSVQMKSHCVVRSVPGHWDQYDQDKYGHGLLLEIFLEFVFSRAVIFVYVCVYVYVRICVRAGAMCVCIHNNCYTYIDTQHTKSMQPHFNFHNHSINKQTNKMWRKNILMRIRFPCNKIFKLNSSVYK